MSLVRSFRATIVEGRFVILFTSLLVIGMRAALFYGGTLPEPGYHAEGYLWRYLAHLFTDPMGSAVASTLSLFLMASIISVMDSRFALIRSRSNLPFVVPLFLLSLHPWFLVMRSDYLSVIFILLAFFPLLGSYQKAEAYLYSFRSGVLIAVASLFQVYALLLILLWWRGERTMRGPQFRSFLSFLFGVILIYLSLLSFSLLQDDLSGFTAPLLSLASFSLPAMPHFSVTEWLAVALIALFFLSNMIVSISTYSRDKVLTLSLMQFVLFLILFLSLMQLVFWRETLFFLTLSLSFISYLNGYLYTRTRSRFNLILGYSFLFLMLLFYLSHFIPVERYLQ